MRVSCWSRVSLAALSLSLLACILVSLVLSVPPPPPVTATTDGGPLTATPSPTTDDGPLTATTTPTPTATPTPMAPDGYRLYLPAVLRQREGTRYTWTRVDSPTTASLRSVAMSSPDNGWAVGAESVFEPMSCRFKGVILRWNGRAWTVFTTVPCVIFHAVTLVSATDGWAVGVEFPYPCEEDCYDPQAIVLRWDGAQWTRTPLPDLGRGSAWLYSISMVSATDGWIVGEGGYELCNPRCVPITHSIMIHWDGQRWTNVPFIDLSPPTLYSVAMLSATEGWAVGEAILRWDGQSWTRVPASWKGDPLYSVAVTSANNAWIVGDDDVVLHWNGESWFRIPNLLGDFYSITMLSPTEGWIVGTGVILYWDGQMWNRINIPVTNSLNSVRMVSLTDGWIVGDNGTILRYVPEAIFWP